jgi:hypothetical protein
MAKIDPIPFAQHLVGYACGVMRAITEALESAQTNEAYSCEQFEKARDFIDEFLVQHKTENSSGEPVGYGPLRCGECLACRKNEPCFDPPTAL